MVLAGTFVWTFLSSYPQSPHEGPPRVDFWGFRGDFRVDFSLLVWTFSFVVWTFGLLVWTFRSSCGLFPFLPFVWTFGGFGGDFRVDFLVVVGVKMHYTKIHA